jgi:hypothetical protein
VSAERRRCEWTIASRGDRLCGNTARSRVKAKGSGLVVWVCGTHRRVALAPGSGWEPVRGADA